MLFDKKTIKFFKSKINNDGYIELPAEGNSMFPLIHRGDKCNFISCSPLNLEKGDIVLFHSKSHQLVAHRFYYQKGSGDTDLYYFKGDTNLGFDQPVTGDRIIGKLAFIQKGTKKVPIKNFSFSLWGWLIISIPVLSGWLRRYLNRKDQLQF